MRIPLLLLCAGTAASALALAPRITFERVEPAPHDLGTVEEAAIVDSPANDPNADAFVERFVDEVNRSGLLRLRDARATTGPAEAHLDVQTLTCDTAAREGEGGMRDADGNRVRRRYFTVEAVCVARIDVLTRFLKYRSTFYAKGAGTSSRVAQVTEETRRDAVARAVRHLAAEAAGRITPRRVRESVALDETAPAFEEAMVLIAADRYAEARALLEKEMAQAPRNAALHYNLAAVCEALRDLAAAKRHYTAARDLAPDNARYRAELNLFARRR